MTRAHGILALVWAAALVWAFALTQPGWWPTPGEKPVPVWTVDPKDVQRLEYNEGTSHVVLTFDPAQRLADGTPAPWIEAEGAAAEAEAPKPPIPPRPGAPPPKGKLPPGQKPGAPAAQSDAKPESAGKVKFRGSVAASRLVRELAQLSALRDVGKLDEKRRGEFGLATPGATLRLERAGGDPLLLDLGMIPAGGGTRYVMVRSTGRVYLVNQGSLRNLERVRRLMDREWMPFPIPDIKRIDAKLGGRTLTVWQLNLPRTEPQRWALTADAAKGDPAALKWVQTLQGMKVLDYGQPADLPAHPEPMLEIVVTPGEPKAGASAAAPAGQTAREPVTLRVFKSAEKTPERLRASSGYTVAPVALGAQAVQSVLDQARELLRIK